MDVGAEDQQQAAPAHAEVTGRREQTARNTAKGRMTEKNKEADQRDDLQHRAGSADRPIPMPKTCHSTAPETGNEMPIAA